MPLRNLSSALLILASLAIPATTWAQTIAGRVLDDLTEAPISTADVMLLDSTDTAVAWAESDSVGRFFIRAPGAGMYRLYAACSPKTSSAWFLGHQESLTAGPMALT